MGYRMNGSPAKLGSIQGTSGHASALKQTENDWKGSDVAKAEFDAQIRENKLKDEIRVLKEGKKKEPSEKTKRLKGETELQDFKTEEWRKRSERLAGKKGIFTGKRKAARKYKKSGKKEDKLKRELEKSERYDQMSPAEKQVFDDERRAMLEANWTDNAAVMANVAHHRRNRLKQQNANKPSQKIQPKPSIVNTSVLGINNAAKIFTHKKYKIGGDDTQISKIQDADDNN